MIEDEKKNVHLYSNSEGGPELKRSVVVFLDVLGFREMHRATSKDPKAAQEILTRLRAALDESEEMLRDKPDPKYHFPVQWSTKGFTDNIVIGHPIHDDGEHELGWTMTRIGYFQLQMIQHGFFVRGAVSVGNVYIDEDIAFGDGLIDAYEGESKLARDARVVLTSSAVSYIRRHLKYYAEPKESPQYAELLQDVDGQWYINYLLTTLNSPDDGGPFIDIIVDHKRKVEECLRKFVKEPSVWSKYLWVANYHDWFCNNYQRYFEKPDDLKIDSRLLRPGPSRIV